MLLKPQFKGVALLAHGLDTGMMDWGITRWKKELADIKAMGADTLWYAPIQFGRCHANDLAERSPFLQLRVAIGKAALASDLKVGVFLGLNDIFSETWAVHPDWHADNSSLCLEEGEVCPQAPGAWSEVLRLRAKLFAALPRIDHLFVPPTDYGGCACERCDPWARQYLRLYEEQAALCRRYHPRAKIVASAYGLPLRQVDMIRADLRFADWVDYVVDVPRGCGKGVIKFYMAPEITMVGGWGRQGPAPVLEQIRRLYRAEGKAVVGVMPYSEGIHDDVNRFACLAFAANPERTCQDVAAEYARKWLGLSGADVSRVAKTIVGLGKDVTLDVTSAAYLDPDRGCRNPHADWRVEVLMAARKRQPALIDNYRYWLLHYRAVIEALNVVRGTLDPGILCAEAELCLQGFERLEPAYAGFLMKSGSHKGLRQTWVVKRTFHAAWRRERRLERTANVHLKV